MMPSLSFDSNTMWPFKLRGFQNECLDAIEQGLDADIARQLVVLPTGSGKTIIFASLLAKLMRRGFGRMLVLAHREELIDQAADKLREVYPGVRLDIEKAEFRADEDAQIVVASIMSVGKKSQEKRLHRFSPDTFDIVVVDEAHHSAAKTYVNILRYFQPKLLLGVTATPKRGDGVPMANIYDAVVFGRTIPELIEEGEQDAELGPYLSRFRGMRVHTDTDLRNINIRKGDFAEGELATACNVDGRNSKIISAIEQHLLNGSEEFNLTPRKCILIFAVDKAHTEALATQLVDRGHNATYVIDGISKQDRTSRIRAYKQGDVRIMVSCGILTEGFDNPRVDAIVMARPVMSPGLFMQMIGRGSRVFPDKDYCVVMDVVDVLGRHKIQTIGDAFGVRGVDFLGEDVYEKAALVQKAMDLGIHFEDDESIEDLERKQEVIEKVMKGTIVVNTRAQMVDVFDCSAVAEEVQRDSEFPWVKIHNQLYVLPMMDKTVTELECDALGRWKIDRYNKEHQMVRPPLVEDEDLVLLTEDADVPFKWADRQARNLNPDTWRAKRAKAKWRNQLATPKQVETLRKIFRIMVIPERFTKGAACDLLDYMIHFSKRARKYLAEGK